MTMINIKKSQTADTRSCDFAKVSRDTLYASSIQHIQDVRKAMSEFVAMMRGAAIEHDSDKLSDIDWFHRDFVTGFKETGWWDNHRRITRHHLSEADGVRDDVNLIDVLEWVADCVMAGMARTGTVRPLTIEPEVLMRAVTNTATLLERHIVVDE
jgi:hypothetical protein